MEGLCEYIGCKNKASKVVKYETSPGKEISVKVCSDHQDQIKDITKKSNL